MIVWNLYMVHEPSQFDSSKAAKFISDWMGWGAIADVSTRDITHQVSQVTTLTGVMELTRLNRLIEGVKRLEFAGAQDKCLSVSEVLIYKEINWNYEWHRQRILDSIAMNKAMAKKAKRQS